ncbi:MAG: uroporphyrin-III C-methyltransferase/precorrin-2 dehydrogenase/sirohydrochlorin ferrochelatase [Oceanospirillaceae bacterium]|jgi:uroporphyrin-III C-methyltransferase/precorrin-2 dehydrogenase/sirohydrochlorin ferrochelatase
MDYLPLFFKLENRNALLVGGGQVALRKARMLVRTKAIVTVVSHEIDPQLSQLLAENNGIAIVGEYHPSLLADKLLVTAATDDETLNKRVYQDALARNLPVNVVDNPALCTFVFPAIVDRSPIVIAISSGGQAPVLVRVLRAKLETLIPNGYSNLALLAGKFRQRVKDKFNTINQRRKFWESILQGQVAETMLAGREQDAYTMMEKKLADANSDIPAGEVYLVGAGPGDPELLTFKALRLMQQADVVMYDALVSKEIMELCRRDADLIFVGKNRDNHSVPQQNINQMLIDHAKQGRRVVRLKGGDPFIFGRGGEELQSLHEHGIPFQVVPGITAASACSTYGGIPLTHRDFAQSVTFVTGQQKNRSSELDYSQLVRGDQTVVFYMGLHNLADICEKLVGAGQSSDTPAAIVSKGTAVDQKVLVGTLDTLVELQKTAQLAAPALIIVGQVVLLQKQLSWFGEQHLPLVTED